MSKTLNLKYGVRQGSIIGPLLFIACTHTVPGAMATALEDFNKAYVENETGCTYGTTLVYADDTNGSRHNKDPQRVVGALNNMSSAMVERANTLELALNGQKTQLLYAGPKARTSLAEGLPVAVGKNVIVPSKDIEILGFVLDSKLSPVPYLQKLKHLLRRVCGVARRTRSLLPPHVHRDLISALCNGRVATYAAAATSVRLAPEQGVAPNLLPSSSLSAQVQVIINNVARATLGLRRSNCIPVRQLLDTAGLRSFNEAAFMSSAMLAWSAMNCKTHPLHTAVAARTLATTTRAASAGKLQPLPPREAAIAITVENAITVWNAHHEIRNAPCRATVKIWAKKLARALPI